MERDEKMTDLHDDPKLKAMLDDVTKLNIKAEMSTDPYIRMKGRFGRDVYIPLTMWLSNEIQTAKDERASASQTSIDLLSVMASGLGVVISSFIADVLSSSETPNAAQHVTSAFLDGLDKTMRKHIEERKTNQTHKI